MAEIVMRLEGLAIPEESPHDGQWLAFYDAAANGGRGEILTTPDLDRALVFPSMVEALHCYRQECGMRPDNRPNRPLTAFTVAFLSLDAARKEAVS